MRRIRMLSLFIAAVMILITGAVTGSVQAAGGAEVAVTADPDQLSTSGTVLLKISITNTSSSPMNDVSITGNGVNEILAPISPGETKDMYIDEYTVTDSMLGKPITFTVYYNGGQTAAGSVTVSRLEVAPNVVLERTCNVSVQETGKPVIFTYTVYNKGTNTVSNVVVRDKFTDAALNDPFSLAPGANKKLQYTYVIDGNTVSRPSVSFSANGKNYINTIDVLYITVPEEALVVEVNASKDEVKPNEALTVNCRITNQSGQKVRNITVTDETGQALGGSFDLGKGQSRTVSKTFTLTDDRSYSITATGYMDGSRVEVSSEPVELRLLEAETLEGLLTVDVRPSVTQFDEPGTVTFSVTISNKSEKTLTDVVVSEQTEGAVETIDTLPTGDRLVSKDYEVDSDRTFAFTVSAKDPDGNAYEVHSGDVRITVAQGTPEPSVTAASATAASGIGAFLTIVIIIVVLIVIAAIVLVILSMQERKAKKLTAGAPEATGAGEALDAAVEEPVEADDVSFIPPDIDDADPVSATGTGAAAVPPGAEASTEPEPKPKTGKKIDDIENPVE